MTPIDQMSVPLPSYIFLETISGAIYGGVPQKLPSCFSVFELKPKSIILMQLESSSKIFSSLRSRWQMLFSWQYAMPSMICLKRFFASIYGMVFLFLKIPARDCCPQFSIISMTFLFSIITDSIWTTFLC